MQWSKLKKLSESFICESLKNRLEYHSTSYNRTHDQTGRCWITLDKKELFNACTVTWHVRYNGLAKEIQKANHCEDFTNPDHRIGYYEAYDEADIIMEKTGVHTQHEFVHALKEIANCSIEDVLASTNRIVRALSLVDRRLGKRRLSQFVIEQDEHPLVIALHKLRCDLEGLDWSKCGS